MSIWAGLFAINWHKHERSLVVEWDNLYQNEHKVKMIREEFIGEPKINPITEQYEPDYPESERNKRYIESFIVSFSFLMLIFVYLIAMYNLTGVIEDEKWNAFFYIDSLGDLAKKDALFDKDTNWNLIPSIAQTVLTMLLNGQFRKMAKKLTDRENHKYDYTYDNSLIIKRFSFEFFDCFLPLIYLGWYELDFKNLRQTVVMLYVVDEIRRVATESLIPWLTNNQDLVKDKVKQLSLSIKKKDAEKKVEESTTEIIALKKLVMVEELEELEKEDHEIFDDYIEMIVTFGYLSMFGCCFLLSAPLILLFIWIECRSDIFKLEKNLKRPIPAKTHHIGSWSICLFIFCFLSIFSNIIVSCYCSDQMDYLLPWLKYYKDDSKTAVATVFALEHILLFTFFALKLILDHDP